jgi:hypothetical protein
VERLSFVQPVGNAIFLCGRYRKDKTLKGDRMQDIHVAKFNSIGHV